jgi:cystathionine beta-lyase
LQSKVKGLTKAGDAGVMARSAPYHVTLGAASEGHRGSDCGKSPWNQAIPESRGHGMDDNKKDHHAAARHQDTRVVTAGREPGAYHGFVNPPVYHASTVLYPNAEDFLAHRSRYQYGRRGTPTTEALELALQELEGPQCAGVSLLPSGLAAVSAAFLSVLKAGDHVLVTDSAYGPTRSFCDQILTRFGVSTTYFDPLASDAVAGLMQANTKAVYLESPGSLSFEMQDVPAIAKTAHTKNALVLMDNTWATPLYFRALDFGVDLSIQAGTKYIGGHSDVMIGTVSANSATVGDLRRTVYLNGWCVGPDDVYLAQRGLRTLAVRLDRHYQSGIAVAKWLEQRPEVLRLLHPALPSHPGHAIWKRDFTGACGLFSVVLKPVPQQAVHAFLDTLELFGIGASWGGYESLAIPFDCAGVRTATRWAPGGPAVRLHIGLEAVEDLIADLEPGFAALTAASPA